MTTEADLIHDLYVISLADGAITRVTQDDHITHFSWSPDGTRFVVSRERAEGDRLLNDLFIIGIDGTDEVRLTYDGVSSRPAWSLQGRIAFIGSASGDFSHRDVFIMDEEGTSLVQLTDDPVVEEGVAWSADGTRLAYTKFGRPCSVLIQRVSEGGPAKLVVDLWDMGGARYLLPGEPSQRGCPALLGRMKPLTSLAIVLLLVHCTSNSPASSPTSDTAEAPSTSHHARRRRVVTSGTGPERRRSQSTLRGCSGSERADDSAETVAVSQPRHLVTIRTSARLRRTARRRQDRRGCHYLAYSDRISRDADRRVMSTRALAPSPSP